MEIKFKNNITVIEISNYGWIKRGKLWKSVIKEYITPGSLTKQGTFVIYLVHKFEPPEKIVKKAY